MAHSARLMIRVLPKDLAGFGFQYPHVKSGLRVFNATSGLCGYACGTHISTQVYRYTLNSKT